jgi:hypothetical protein
MVTSAGRAGRLRGPRRRRHGRPADEAVGKGARAASVLSPRRAGPFGVVIESDGDPLDQVEGLVLPPPVSIREVRGGGPARLRSDDTDARKATVRRFGRSDRSAQQPIGHASQWASSVKPGCRRSSLIRWSRGDVWEAFQGMSFYDVITVQPLELLTLQLRAWPVRRSPRW